MKTDVLKFIARWKCPACGRREGFRVGDEPRKDRIVYCRSCGAMLQRSVRRDSWIGIAIFLPLVLGPAYLLSEAKGTISPGVYQACSLFLYLYVAVVWGFVARWVIQYQIVGDTLAK